MLLFTYTDSQHDFLINNVDVV